MTEPIVHYGEKKCINAEELIKDMLETLDNHGNSPIELRTGFNSLDNKIGGFKKSELIVIQSERVINKTPFTCKLTLNLSCKENIPVGMIGYEDNLNEKIKLILSIEADQQLGKIHNNEDKADAVKIEDAISVIQEAPIHFYRNKYIKFDDFEREISNMVQKYNLKVIFIHNLKTIRDIKLVNRIKCEGIICNGPEDQDIDCHKFFYEDIYDNDNLDYDDQIYNLSTEKKVKMISKLAKVLGVTIVLSDDTPIGLIDEKTTNSSIEYLNTHNTLEDYADVLMILSSRPNSRNKINLYLAKNKFGPTSVISLIYDFNKGGYKAFDVDF